MSRGFALLTLLAFGTLTACAPTTQVGDDPMASVDAEQLDRAIERARADLTRRPEEARILRDLGALLALAERFDEAGRYLRQAYVEDTSDPKTLYFLGLVNEAEGDPGEALEFYGRFPSVSVRSSYRSLLQGRYEYLVRERLRAEVEQIAAREDTLAAGEASLQTVAVFPFAYLGDEPRYAPLGRGLGEMVQADLAGISTLQVVERLRLQALLDELELAQSDAFDPAATPRVGRLLRAGRAVGGSFDVTDRDLRIDAALWELETEPSPDLQTRSDDLDELFDLKREVVLALVEQMGLQLTAEERAFLDRVPTRSIQAFLLYSRGLEEEDAGNFALAAQQFRQAVKADPSFEQAAAGADRAAAVDQAGGSIEQGLSAAADLEDFGGIDLVGSRLRKLNDSVGASFLPGAEGNRDNPAGEAAAARDIFEPLPPPPAPPGGN
jgi:TolB-like protein